MNYTVNNQRSKKYMKRLRCENWIEEEKILLAKLVKQYISIVENKNTDSNTNKKKNEAWTKICISFNKSTHQKPRTVKQMKTQWSIIKMKMKFLTKERKLSLKTRGGKVTLESLDTTDFAVETSMSDSDSTVIKMLDDGELFENSNGNIEIKVENDNNDLDDTVMTHEDKAPVTVDKEQIQSEDQISDDDYDAQRNKLAQRNKVSQTQKKKTKKLQTNTVQEATRYMAALVGYDKRLKQQLHQIQMENEQIKQKVLLMKLEYWRKNVAALDAPKDDSPTLIIDGINGIQHGNNSIKGMILRNNFIRDNF